jgi:GR25 family glycosyltransferase involved in LPS biosynthesis
LRRIAEGPAPFGVVLEDDAILSRALPGFLAAFAAAAPPIDIVKLDGFGERVLVPRDPPTAIGGAALRRIVSFRPGTTGYVVAKAAAARLIGHPRLRAAPIDATLYYPFLPAMPDMTVRHVEPALCTQPAGTHADSTIEGPRNAARRARKLHRTWRDTLLRTLHQRGLQLHDGLCVLGGARRRRSTLAPDLVAPSRGAG